MEGRAIVREANAPSKKDPSFALHMGASLIRLQFMGKIWIRI